LAARAGLDLDGKRAGAPREDHAEIFAVTTTRPRARRIFTSADAYIRLVWRERVDIVDIYDIEPMHVARREGRRTPFCGELQ
jgi:hypothetical protein